MGIKKWHYYLSVSRMCEPGVINCSVVLVYPTPVGGGRFPPPLPKNDNYS